MMASTLLTISQSSENAQKNNSFEFDTTLLSLSRSISVDSSVYGFPAGVVITKA